jgi:hypothetical protein
MRKLGIPAVFRIRIRIESAFDGGLDPDPEHEERAKMKEKMQQQDR